MDNVNSAGKEYSAKLDIDVQRIYCGLNSIRVGRNFKYACGWANKINYSRTAAR